MYENDVQSCLVINHMVQEGSSALHLATKMGNVEAVKNLLEYEGNPSLLSKVAVLNCAFSLFHD